MLVAPRRAYHKTTDSHHRFRRHPNLLKEGPHQVRATASEQVWVPDITYYDCYQNALAERVNGILKMEFLLHRPADLAQASRMVQQAVQIYNQERPHHSLKLKTPDEVHRASLSGWIESAMSP